MATTSPVIPNKFYIFQELVAFIKSNDQLTALLGIIDQGKLSELSLKEKRSVKRVLTHSSSLPNGEENSPLFRTQTISQQLVKNDNPTLSIPQFKGLKSTEEFVKSLGHLEFLKSLLTDRESFKKLPYDQIKFIFLCIDHLRLNFNITSTEDVTSTYLDEVQSSSFLKDDTWQREILIKEIKALLKANPITLNEFSLLELQTEYIKEQEILDELSKETITLSFINNTAHLRFIRKYLTGSLYHNFTEQQLKNITKVLCLCHLTIIDKSAWQPADLELFTFIKHSIQTQYIRKFLHDVSKSPTTLTIIKTITPEEFIRSEANLAHLLHFAINEDQYTPLESLYYNQMFEGIRSLNLLALELPLTTKILLQTILYAFSKQQTDAKRSRLTIDSP